MSNYITTLKLIACFVTFLPPTTHSMYMKGTPSSYAQYPKINLCQLSSLKFQFKTSQSESLLVYYDDGGVSDFIEILHRNGHVNAVFNFVDERQGNQDLDITNVKVSVTNVCKNQ